MSVKSPVIIDVKFHEQEVVTALKTAFPDRETINLADPANQSRDLSGIDYAVVWKPHHDLFSRAPNLKVVFSGGAGVDHVLKLPGLPDIPLVRFIDRSLTTRMSEWVVMQCLLHLRQAVAYETLRAKKIWEELVQPEACDLTVGIMGVGVLGQDAATKLKVMGFNVIGWSRTAKSIPGIQTFDGGQLDVFLSKTDILVGLLPLTAETKGIFNLSLFKKLRSGGALNKPVFVNAGRGGSQVESDIVAALETGVLGGASLDVFETEPLPTDSPFWTMKNVFFTPHAAAASDSKALFKHVEIQIARFETGQSLQGLVNKTSGY